MTSGSRVFLIDGGIEGGIGDVPVRSEFRKGLSRMNPNNMGDLLRQAGRMKKDMDRVQEELKTRYVQASAGGDLVEVTANGQQEVVKVSINPKFFGQSGSKVDVELLEDLILAATTQALEKSRTLMRQEMEKVGGGLGGLLPGLL